jgi:hypothetical protein
MADNDAIRPDSKFLPCLTYSQAEVSFILGHSLRALYQPQLDQPLPGHLRNLLDQLEERLAS